MIRVVEDEVEIQELQELLLRRVHELGGQSGEMTLTFRPNTYTGPGVWFESSGLWVVADSTEGRWWTALGLGRPFDEVQEIVVELNAPFEGINRSVSGAFGKDDEGRAYVLHRGNLVHLPGFRKEAFLDYYGRAHLVEVADGDRITELIAVAALDSSTLAVELADFAEIADEFKQELRETGTSPHERPDLTNQQAGGEGFTPEPEDDYQRDPLPQGVVRRQHGLVVNALAKELVSRGHRVGSDQQRDLFTTAPDGTVAVLFEVKVPASSQALYTAVGQLKVHSVTGGGSRLVAVLPSGTSGARRRVLSVLGISVVEWSVVAGAIEFAGLE